MTDVRSTLCIALSLAGLLILCGPAVAQEPPRRIASANLCTDQLVLALADRGQIASLSPLARDPALSFLADEAAQLPGNRASAEDVLRLDADLVLVGPYDNRATRELLTARGLRVRVVEPWTSFEMGRQQIRDLAALFGHPEKGERLLGALDAALAELPRIAMPDATSALVLHRRGYVYHAGLTAEITARAGLRDAAPDFGLGDYGFVTLEALVQRRPDFLIVADADTVAGDMGQAFLQHPALSDIWPERRRLVAPDRLTICGGPSTPALIAALGAEIRSKVMASGN